MATNAKSYPKYCIVPGCQSTSFKTPDKTFLSVPKDMKKRKEWCKAMKRDPIKNPPLSPTSSRWCCEDHFLLEEDLENYWEWKLTNNVQRLKLKDGVVPRIFKCQGRNISPPKRKAAHKRKQQELVNEAIAAVSDEASTSENLQEEEEASQTSISDHSSALPISTLNKSVQAKMKFRSVGTSTVVRVTSVSCSPIKLSSPPKQIPLTVDSLVIENETKFPDEEYKPESPVSNYSSSDDELSLEKYKNHMLTGTTLSIEKNPKLFLGLPNRSYCLIKLISETVPVIVRNIYIVLKKLRLDNQFAILAIDFGLCESSISRIFKKVVPILAQVLQDLIVWPDPIKIQSNLPIAFRARYAKVVSIIDCLEIQIEKPGNPVHQALTWSQYYNCNTVKYLISCTPDGLVNFISEGFGGRTSDSMIVEHSGYLEKLDPGSTVMADRGFKHISPLLQLKGSQLVRPPSVATGTISTKADVKLSKRIASLRIHVERVIGRLREFRMLTPHSCIDNHLIPYTDHLLIIACGMINMQDHLIKDQI